MSTEEKNNSENKKEIKIVICGDMRVGKTSILSRYIYNSFDENPMSTVSKSYQKIIMKNNIKLICNFWDTAGQEKFRSLNKLFYKNSNVALIVYDITKKDTFYNVKSFWVSEIKSYAPNDVLICIIGNKFDLYKNEEVTEEDARNYAEKNNYYFTLTSAFENTGIDELFEDLTDKLLGIERNEINEKKRSFKIKKKMEKPKKIKEKKECC